jgi:pyruvate/2-oxoglutarate dehydrogenase complex dihydrolipoamide acyltransferase (E2) component
MCGALIGLVTLENEKVAVAAAASPVSVRTPRQENGERNGERTIASPAARKLAREHNLDVREVRGSGPRGRITLSDVLARAAAQPLGKAAVAPPPLASLGQPTAPAQSAPAELDPMRRTIFRRMSDVGVLPLAQVETNVRVDGVHALIARRKDFGWTAFAVYALARLLREHPALRTDARSGRPAEALDIGVAADTPRGLLVPVVRGAASLSLAAIQTEILRLAAAARAGSLAPADSGGAVFSLSNVGPQGVERVAPLVDPPQTAILGMGAATRRPAVVGEAIVPAWMLTLVLTFDHRFVDGAPAARFLSALAGAFAEPGLLL